MLKRAFSVLCALLLLFAAPAFAQTPGTPVSGGQPGLQIGGPPINASGNVPVQDNTVANAITSAALTPPYPVQVAGSHVVTDVASAAVTTNGASAIIADIGQSNASVVNVSAVSGTSPTLDVVEWESNDGGVNDWHPVYALPRITTAGVYLVPNHAIAGVRKWVYTLGGTSPSFTFSILSSRGHVAAPVLRSFWDRTIAPNTGGSTTATFFAGGAKYFVVNVNMASGGTAGTMQWQFSNDGVTWNYLGSAFTATVNAVTVNYPTVPIPMAYVRLVVASAGTGTTLNSINISASN